MREWGYAPLSEVPDLVVGPVTEQEAREAAERGATIWVRNRDRRAKLKTRMWRPLVE